MKNKKIAILLPFKDHFTHLKAGSASIWVKDFNNKSKYKNNITILGNTDSLNNLIDKKRYKNLELKKNAFRSKNNSYVNEFIKQCNISKYDLVEIHNRPSYIHYLLKKNISINLVLIFHNNPLALGGSNKYPSK